MGESKGNCSLTSYDEFRPFGRAGPVIVTERSLEPQRGGKKISVH